MILQRYIGVSLAKGWLLVMLVLAAIFGLIGFIEELDRTTDDYDAIAAARYTLFILPNQLVSLAPIIALLGSIVALANLDRFNELTIISCTGFPPGKLLTAIALPTVLLVAGLWLCMEYLAPQLQQSAERERSVLRYSDNISIPDGGVWSTNGRRYIHLQKMFENGIPGDISLFEFGNSGELIRALHARTAKVSDDRRWLFQGVREKRLVDGKLVSRQHKELEILQAAGAKVCQCGMALHAGHGLTYRNVKPVARIDRMHELNIGHSIVARAIMVGLQQAVREMKQLVS